MLTEIFNENRDMEKYRQQNEKHCEVWTDWEREQNKETNIKLVLGITGRTSD